MGGVTECSSAGLFTQKHKVHYVHKILPSAVSTKAKEEVTRNSQKKNKLSATIAMVFSEEIYCSQTLLDIIDSSFDFFFL